MGLASSYTSGTSDTGLIGETIGANLAATAARRGAADALVDVPSGRRWSYTELYGWSRQVARGLLARRVGPGDRVGIWSPNCPEWVALQYGTALIGAILVNINPAYRTSELEFVLRQSGVRTLVSATVHKTSDYRAMVEEVRPRAPGVTHVVLIGDPGWDDLVAGAAGVSDERLDEVSAGLTFD
ncbi:MAG: AMP-binding protein, partial [Actinomycetes bacterium]